MLHYSDRPRVRQGNVLTHLKLLGKIAQELGNGQKEITRCSFNRGRNAYCMDYQVP